MRTNLDEVAFSREMELGSGKGVADSPNEFLGGVPLTVGEKPEKPRTARRAIAR